jgi:hypothetical protein
MGLHTIQLPALDLNVDLSTLPLNNWLPSPETVTLLYTLSTLLFPLLAFIYLHKDYKDYLSLGPGGTPSTPLGYLKIKTLSLISLRDPLRPLPVPPHFRPQHGYLTSTSLAVRAGIRPTIRGIAPQRQQSQKSSAEVYAKLVAGLRALTADPANHLIERTSCFEKHSSGLFASTPITRTCGGEICHAHPSDGSLHLSLHPADARILIQAGWGERHPLAKGGWFRRFVPREFVLVYAPRDEKEVETVLEVVAAAVWWVSGVDVNAAGDTDGRDRGMNAEEMLRAKASQEKVCGACRIHGYGSNRVEKLIGDS